MKLTEARILVVDDNQELCSLVENICRQEGFSHVETAFSCREAESRIKSGDVDFLILDVNLPFEDRAGKSADPGSVPVRAGSG